MINVTDKEYDYPKTISGSYFHGQASKVTIPTFKEWQRNHHIHFLRYLWYLLDQNFDNDYPSIDISDEDLQKKIDDLEEKIKKQLSSSNEIRPIKKILIGEAPPLLPHPPAKGNYFYHTGSWPQKPGPWINAPKKCMFLNKTYTSKDLFLQNCAKKGFLLLDLFPYAIKFTSSLRNGPDYKVACKEAFNNPNGNYPLNILSTLNQLKNHIHKDFTIVFGMNSFGETILNDKIGCVTSFISYGFNLQNPRNASLISFNNYMNSNHLNLKNLGVIDFFRLPKHNLANSNFLHVVSDNSNNPNATLLKVAGF